MTDSVTTTRRFFLFADRSQPATEVGPSGCEMFRYSFVALLAGLVCLAVATIYLGLGVLTVAAVALAGALATEAAFALLRKKPLTGGSLTFAVLLALVLPASTPVWMVLVAAVFGMVFGREIFGGQGHYIFNPVLLALGVLVWSYPVGMTGYSFATMLTSLESGPVSFALTEAACPTMATWLCFPPYIVCSATALLGAFAVVAARKGNYHAIERCLQAAAVVAVLIYIMDREAFPFDNFWEIFLADGFALGLFFFVGNPSTTPRNNTATILYGVIIGASAILMRCYSNYTQAMMSAVLMGNLFAPMLQGIFAKKTAADAPAPSN